MTRFAYFAYGSNMLTQRLTARCPSAVVTGPAEARGYAVSYCMHSTDDSAKAGLLPDASGSTWGVLFSIAQSEQEILDSFEGTPDLYRRETIKVLPADGGASVTAVTYLPQPNRIVANGRPYAWYRALCVGGARQHDLPLAAAKRLMETEVLAMPAPDALAWQSRARALAALKQAGLSMPEEGV